MWWNATVGEGGQVILFFIVMGYYAIQIMGWIRDNYFRKDRNGDSP